MQKTDFLRFLFVVIIVFLWWLYIPNIVDFVFSYFWISNWEVSQQFITIFLLFPFIIWGIILWLIWYFWVVSIFLEKKYKSFKKQYTWSIFFIYGKFHNTFIETEIIPHLQKEIIMCDMSLKKYTKNFSGIPRAMIWELHREADNYKGKKQKSLYVIHIDKNGSDIKVLCIRSHLGNKKSPQKIVEEIQKFIS